MNRTENKKKTILLTTMTIILTVALLVVVMVVQYMGSEESKVPAAGSLTYEAYLELPVEEQEAYYASFESVEAFFEWLNAAKEETRATEEYEGELEIEEESVEDWD